ncbi:MAG: hypothetical protein J7501_03190 [Bdellovibrio sp.]|nr:hypothetical protein [Bdellovibrio sp.]
MRQIARILECNYKTVHDKIQWMGIRAKDRNSKQDLTSETLFIDEMETIEHTKLKPLTIAVAVNENYKILGVRVGTIPAKGKTAAISYKKYGYRENQSAEKTKELLSQISQQISKPFSVIKSDAKPSYSKIINEAFPNTPYQQFIAAENKEKRREQKYLKSEKLIYDPIFPVNHTCAKFRDHIKRLSRRNWCTTKIKENLELHLNLYIAYTNNYNFL